MIQSEASLTAVDSSQDVTEDKWLILHRWACVQGSGMRLRVALPSVMSIPAVCQVYEGIFNSAHAHRRHFGQLGGGHRESTQGFVGIKQICVLWKGSALTHSLTHSVTKKTKRYDSNLLPSYSRWSYVLSCLPNTARRKGYLGLDKKKWFCWVTLSNICAKSRAYMKMLKCRIS